MVNRNAAAAFLPESFDFKTAIMKMRVLGSLFLLVAMSAYAKPLYDTRAVDISMQALMADYALDGGSIRLARDGRVQMEEYYGSYGASTRVPIASASKWLSALVIARLVEKGQLQWQDTVGKWIPDAPADKRGITLTQLFSHTSGLPGNETTGCLSNRFITLDNCARQILDLPLESTPGSSFSYGGNSMQVAGRLAEIASGKNWNLIFYDELVVPLGLTSTDFATGSTQEGYVWTGNPRIAGGVRSTQADYGRVVDVLLAGGFYGNQAYLDGETLAFMAFNQAAGKVVISTPIQETSGYGIGQWVEGVDSRGITTRVSSPGAFGMTPWVDWAAGNNGIIFVKDQRTRIVDGLNEVQVLAISALSKRHYISPPPISKPQSNKPARTSGTSLGAIKK